jgi:DNA-binding response OmpR family regulator
MYVREVLERMQVQTSVVRSLPRAWAAVTVPPPDLLVLGLPSTDASAHLEFASTLRANRGTSCVFVIERLDRDAEIALSELGDKSVLCKPVHRDQLEATCLMALRQSPPGEPRGPVADEQNQLRERHLELALRAIADVVEEALRVR